MKKGWTRNDRKSSRQLGTKKCESCHRMSKKEGRRVQYGGLTHRAVVEQGGRGRPSAPGQLVLALLSFRLREKDTIIMRRPRQQKGQCV